MAKETAEADQTTVVYLGNRNAIEVLPDPKNEGQSVRAKVPGPKKNCTTITLGEARPGAPLTLLEAAQQITDPARGVWQAHSDAEKPAWVAASGPIGPALAQLLGQHWGIEVREPDPTHGTEG